MPNKAEIQGYLDAIKQSVQTLREHDHRHGDRVWLDLIDRIVEEHLTPHKPKDIEYKWREEVRAKTFHGWDNIPDTEHPIGEAIKRKGSEL